MPGGLPQAFPWVGGQALASASLPGRNGDPGTGSAGASPPCPLPSTCVLGTALGKQHVGAVASDLW